MCPIKRQRNWSRLGPRIHRRQCSLSVLEGLREPHFSLKTYIDRYESYYAYEGLLCTHVYLGKVFLSLLDWILSLVTAVSLAPIMMRGQKSDLAGSVVGRDALCLQVHVLLCGNVGRWSLVGGP